MNNIQYLTSILNILENIQDVEDTHEEVDDMYLNYLVRHERNFIPQYTRNVELSSAFVPQQTRSRLPNYTGTFSEIVSNFISSSLSNYIQNFTDNLTESVIQTFSQQQTLEKNENVKYSGNNICFSELQQNDKELYKSCAICFEDFCEDSKISITNCKHSYHYDCISEWAKYKTNCPVCRKDF